MSGLKEKDSHNFTKKTINFNFLWEDNFRVTPAGGMKIRTGSREGRKSTFFYKLIFGEQKKNPQWERGFLHTQREACFLA